MFVCRVIEAADIIIACFYRCYRDVAPLQRYLAFLDLNVIYNTINKMFISYKATVYSTASAREN